MRSRKKKSQKGAYLLGLVIILGAATCYFFLSSNVSSSSLRTVEDLNPDIYYEDANSIRGNTYKLDAEIDSFLGTSPTKGRLFSVNIISNPKNADTTHTMLPILVPIQQSNLSIQKGQHYLLKLKVGDDGLLTVEEAYKP
jgi:hypothetical protein